MRICSNFGWSCGSSKQFFADDPDDDEDHIQADHLKDSKQERIQGFDLGSEDMSLTIVRNSKTEALPKGDLRMAWKKKLEKDGILSQEKTRLTP